MRARVLVSILAILLTVVIAGAQQSKHLIRITAPTDKTHVSDRPAVEGTVTDSQDRVWVIVHPLEVSDYWVQPSVTVREDGTWKVIPYIGRPGGADIGKEFELMAVANPKAPLKEGLVLSGWPEAQARSQVVEVTRK
jgi:hypothetical protein